VVHWQIIRVSVALISAQVFALDGQSAPSLQVWTHCLAVGWQSSLVRQSVSVVHVAPVVVSSPHATNVSAIAAAVTPISASLLSIRCLLGADGAAPDPDRMVPQVRRSYDGDRRGQRGPRPPSLNRQRKIDYRTETTPAVRRTRDRRSMDTQNIERFGAPVTRRRVRGLGATRGASSGGVLVHIEQESDASARRRMGS
jgi:hypothetical protein